MGGTPVCFESHTKHTNIPNGQNLSLETKTNLNNI